MGTIISGRYFSTTRSKASPSNILNTSHASATCIAGAIRKNIKVQTEKEQEYLALYEETVLKAVGEVRNAVTDASQDHIKSEELKSAVESAQQAESLAQTNFDSGLSDYLSVLDARRNVLSARRQYIMSRGQEFADTVRLFKSLGGGWEAMDMDQEAEADSHAKK